MSIRRNLSPPENYQYDKAKNISHQETFPHCKITSLHVKLNLVTLNHFSNFFLA